MIAQIISRFFFLMLTCCTVLLLGMGCSSQKGVIIKGEQGDVKSDAKAQVKNSTYPVPDEVKKKMEQSGTGKATLGNSDAGKK